MIQATDNLAPWEPPPPINDDDLDHIICCNVDEAVCGRNVTDIGFCVPDCTVHETCKECADILADDTWICPDCRLGWAVE